MHDRQPRSKLLKGHQDLLHTLILLATVPLLFFGALKLVEKSTDVLKEPEPVTGNTESETAKVPSEEVAQKKEATSPTVSQSPPPGEDWLREITPLEQRAVLLRATSQAAPERVGQCLNRLAIFRRHIEQHLDAVPQSNRNDHPLRIALQRLSEEISSLSQAVPKAQDGLNWKAGFATFDADQRAKHSRNVDREFERLTAPLIEPHRSALAALTRKSQNLSEQIQVIRDKELLIENKTDRELARQARLLKFEPIRVEALRLLSPFITPAYSQPGSDAHNWVQTQEKKPVSRQALERLGALEPTLRGLETLSKLGGQQWHNPETRRPWGSFPTPDNAALTRPRDIETVKRAQQLLIEHGQTLIDEGLLSP